MVLLSPSNSDAREDALLSALNAVSDFLEITVMQLRYIYMYNIIIVYVYVLYSEQ